ncbi:MAG TPA: (2Fe-2S)-binding protein [Candidatus Binataceae bacterium]|nr:(2Fe-2S)-binding protein [Candidatus Binataceae bacterium]
MILCHCAAVSDSTIEALIEGGASTLSQVTRQCGAGRNCASCREEIISMLSRARQSYAPPVSELAAD